MSSKYLKNLLGADIIKIIQYNGCKWGILQTLKLKSIALDKKDKLIRAIEIIGVKKGEKLVSKNKIIN
jgi:hypothetical protein